MVAVRNDSIRPSTKDDLEYLMQNIRPEDKEEILALTGLSVREAINEIPDFLDYAMTWEVNDKVVCIAGIHPCEPFRFVGTVWLLGTKEFDNYSRLFAIKCKRAFKEAIKNYEYLYNYVYEKNTKSIKWIKSLGFKVLDAEPIGANGAKFHKFEMKPHVSTS